MALHMLIWCQYFSPWRGNRFTSNSSFLAAKPVGQEVETVKQTYTNIALYPGHAQYETHSQDRWGLGMRLSYDTIAKGNELFTPRKKINLHKILLISNHTVHVLTITNVCCSNMLYLSNCSHTKLQSKITRLEEVPECMMIYPSSLTLSCHSNVVTVVAGSEAWERGYSCRRL